MGKLKENRAITLIALVITIIVLLILAGVSIAMLTGNNGIIMQAQTAKEKTEKAQWEEKIDLSIISVEGKKRNATLYNIIKELKREGVIEDESKVDKKTGNIITTKPSYLITGKLENYIVESVKPGEVVDKTVVDNYIDSKNKSATIPKGFKVSIVEGEKEIDTGLVVIGPDESEFVWVPVDNDTLNSDGTEDKEMAELVDGKYRGVLYSYSGITSKKRTYDSLGYREPDVLSDEINADGNTEYLVEMSKILGLSEESKIATIDEFKKYMQEEYSYIIESIKTNGGFYIGRYESSLSGSNKTTVAETGNIQSKKDIMPTSASNPGTYRWYGLYAKQKLYSKTLIGVDSNLKSGMIYGSTYDAMLNWALNGNDKDKIDQNSIMRGPESTGALPSDKINNIYDLGNNLYEWTVEAYSTNVRVCRR